LTQGRGISKRSPDPADTVASRTLAPGVNAIVGRSVLSAQTRAAASRGRMLETSREQVSALPAVGTGRHSGRCFFGWSSRSPRSSETTARLPLRRQERQPTRPGVGVGPCQGTVAASPRSLCRVSSREGTPSEASQQTDAAALPCRSDPETIAGLPPPACPHLRPAIPAVSALYGFKCASKNARMRRRASRADSSW
jgi:hypothetical protein